MAGRGVGRGAAQPPKGGPQSPRGTVTKSVVGGQFRPGQVAGEKPPLREGMEHELQRLLDTCGSSKQGVFIHYSWRLVLSWLATKDAFDFLSRDDVQLLLPHRVAQVLRELLVLKEIDEDVFYFEVARYSGMDEPPSQGGDHSVPLESFEGTELLCEVMKRSFSGDAQAQFKLGVMYRTGNLVNSSFENAMLWLKKACDQGHVDALSNVAYMYKKGMGVEQDLLKAGQFYQQAADLGSDSAAYNFGVMVMSSQGVERDDELAVHYLKIASRTLAAASFNLGYLFEEQGNIEEAMEFYAKAASQGDEDSKHALYRLQNDDDGEGEEAE